MRAWRLMAGDPIWWRWSWRPVQDVIVDGVGGEGFPVEVAASDVALVEGAAGAEQDRQVVVQVVAEPVADAGRWLEPEHFPGSPQCGEPGDGFGVGPPSRAPAELPAERADEHGPEVALKPVLDAPEDRLRGVLLLGIGLCAAGAGRGGHVGTV